MQFSWSEEERAIDDLSAEVLAKHHDDKAPAGAPFAAAAWRELGRTELLAAPLSEAAGGAEILRDGPPLVFQQVRDHDPRTEFGEEPRFRFTLSPCGAGNERHLAFEIDHAAPPRRPPTDPPRLTQCMIYAKIMQEIDRADRPAACRCLAPLGQPSS